MGKGGKKATLYRVAYMEGSFKSSLDQTAAQMNGGENEEGG